MKVNARTPCLQAREYVRIHGPLLFGYHWEWQFLDKVRHFKDGITFFETTLDLSLYPNHHNPKMEFGVMVCNVILSDITVYKSR